MDESIAFMERSRNQPFFLFLSFYTVHTPIQPCKRLLEENKARALALQLEGPPSIKERSGSTKLWQDNAAYASMVQAMDENVGRLLRRLDELEMADKTIVVFTSDNGGLSTKKTANNPTSNAPLRAGKGWCYEGGIRVPLIISALGVSPAGSTCGVPVTSTDLYPTILGLAGLPAMPSQHSDGVDLAPLLKGKKMLGRKAIYWHYPHYHGSTWAPGGAIRAGDWKLIEFFEEEKHELYRLGNDLGEREDLSRRYPEKAKELLDMLHRWREDIGAKMPERNADFSGA